jgi:Ni/Co efflux regulator RcnB
MIGEMRRPMPLLAVIALSAGLLAGAGEAVGKDHGGGHREEGRHEQGPGGGEGGRWGPGRQGGPGPAYRGEEYRGGGGGYERRGYPQGGDPRMDPRIDPRYGYRADPRYDPRAYAAPPSYGGSARRGGYLGPGAGGEVIQDPGRFRLRAPPHGYEWVRTSRGMALVSQSTGQVFDVVPY